MSRPKHDNGHARKRHQRARHIPSGWPDALDSPQPYYRHKNIDAAVCGIGSACGYRMKRQKPGKQREAGSSGHQKPRALTLLEPEIRQVTADDFGKRRSQEKKYSFQLKHSGGFYALTYSRIRGRHIFLCQVLLRATALPLKKRPVREQSLSDYR